MRGLTDRVAIAYERVLITIAANCGGQPQAHNTQAFSWRAEDHGYQDYVTDRTRAMPAMYADEPVLAEGWRNGQLEAADDEEREALALIAARSAWYAEPDVPDLIANFARRYPHGNPVCSIHEADIPF